MEKEQSFFSTGMQNPEFVLDILSSSGDWDKHSLCPFCRWNGQLACPNHGTQKQKQGYCARYDFNGEPLELVECRIQEYIQGLT